MDSIKKFNLEKIKNIKAQGEDKKLKDAYDILKQDRETINKHINE